MPDLKSVAVAAFIGAAFLWLVQPSGMSDGQKLGIGAFTGIAVQVGVRILGVS